LIRLNEEMRKRLGKMESEAKMKESENKNVEEKSKDRINKLNN